MSSYRFAMTVYTYLNLKEAHESVEKPLVLNQNSFSSLKGKLEKLVTIPMMGMKVQSLCDRNTSKIS